MTNKALSISIEELLYIWHSRAPKVGAKPMTPNDNKQKKMNVILSSTLGCAFNSKCATRVTWAPPHSSVLSKDSTHLSDMTEIPTNAFIFRKLLETLKATHVLLTWVFIQQSGKPLQDLCSSVAVEIKDVFKDVFTEWWGMWYDLQLQQSKAQCSHKTSGSDGFYTRINNTFIRTYWMSKYAAERLPVSSPFLPLQAFLPSLLKLLSTVTLK